MTAGYHLIDPRLKPPQCIRCGQRPVQLGEKVPPCRTITDEKRWADFLDLLFIDQPVTGPGGALPDGHIDETMEVAR